MKRAARHAELAIGPPCERTRWLTHPSIVPEATIAPHALRFSAMPMLIQLTPAQIRSTLRKMPST